MGKVKVKHYGATKHCVFGDCVSDNRFDLPGYDPHRGFYCFPKPCAEIKKLNITDPQIRREHLKKCKYCEGVEQWVQSCKSKTLTSIAKITRNTYICDRHFIKKYSSIREINHHLIIPRSVSIIKQMRESSVTDSTAEEVNWELEQESNLLEHSLENPPVDQVLTKDTVCQTDFTGEELDALLLEINKLKVVNENPSNTPNVKQKHGEIDKFENKLKTNPKMCKFYTGMTFSTIQSILSFLCVVENNTAITYWGKKTPQIHRKSQQWSFRQELIIALVRLRTGLLVEDIGYRFGVAHSSVSKLVNTWVQILYHKFNSIRPYMFPSREVIKETLPASFANFKNIRVIIDATEIWCQVPKDYQHQGNLYSQYKSHTTLKVLIGCTPNGAVSFVSDVLEGSISDRELVIKSKLMDLLDEDDLVLSDRGFTIKDVMDEKNCTLKIPAFLMGRDKLTAQEEVETKILAQQRIYVEHVMGRLKQF